MPVSNGNDFNTSPFTMILEFQHGCILVDVRLLFRLQSLPHVQNELIKVFRRKFAEFDFSFARKPVLVDYCRGSEEVQRSSRPPS